MAYDLPIGFNRIFKGPIDVASRFTSTTELNDYLTEPTRYAGQLAVVAEGGGAKIYVLNDTEDGWILLFDTESSNTVFSVNSKTGAVVLNPDDLDDSSTTNKFVTAQNIADIYSIPSSRITDKGGALGVAELDENSNVIHNISTSYLTVRSATEITINFNQNLVVSTLDKREFRMVKWLVNVTDTQSGEFFSCEILAHHNGTSVEYTEFASIGNETVSFTSSLDGNNFNLYGFSSENGQNVRVITTATRI